MFWITKTPLEQNWETRKGKDFVEGPVCWVQTEQSLQVPVLEGLEHKEARALLSFPAAVLCRLAPSSAVLVSA